MFGGLAFLVDGHLVASASSQGGMLLRVPPTETASLLEESGVNRFEMRGRPMDGWLLVDAQAVAGEASLRRWLNLGTAYARSLPPK